MTFSRIITKRGIPCVEYAPLHGRITYIRLPVEVDVTTSRRAAIAMLGLAPASAIAADSFLYPGKGLPETGSTTKKAIVTALRNLASNIENGTVLTSGIDYNCKLEVDAVVEHHLNLSFVYNPAGDWG